MGKKSKNNKQKKNANWLPPEGASAYFSVSSDAEFKRKHPIGYFFLVVLGLIALLAPTAVYGAYVINTFGDEMNVWCLLGMLGSMAIGVGLFNYVAIIIKQYLGHLVSILSFVIGSILIWISIVQLAAL